MASNNDDLPDDLHADNDSVEIIWEAVFEDEESPPESEEEELEVKKSFFYIVTTGDRSAVSYLQRRSAIHTATVLCGKNRHKQIF